MSAAVPASTSSRGGQPLRAAPASASVSAPRAHALPHRLTPARELTHACTLAALIPHMHMQRLRVYSHVHMLTCCAYTRARMFTQACTIHILCDACTAHTCTHAYTLTTHTHAWVLFAHSGNMTYCHRNQATSGGLSMACGMWRRDPPGRVTGGLLTAGCLPFPPACNCHGHADDCSYDPEVDRRNASLNQDSVFQGGGVCLHCQVGSG